MPIGSLGFWVLIHLRYFLGELKLLRFIKYFAYLEVRKSFSFY